MYLVTYLHVVSEVLIDFDLRLVKLSKFQVPERAFESHYY